MKYAIFFLVYILLFPTHLGAKNLDSLLSTQIHIDKPYLIINLTSHDCITCRAGAAGILNELRANSYKDKIIILSDDKNMEMYYQDNEEIYSGYKKVYDKDLSDILALGLFNSASIVEKAGIRQYLLKNVNEDTLNYFKRCLSNSDISSSVIIKDSIFANYSRLFSGNETAFIFNMQFQIGLIYSTKYRNHKYVRPKYNDTSINELYKILVSCGIKKLTNTAIDRTGFKKMGLSEISFASINLHDSSLYLKLYAVAKDTVDTNVNTFYMPSLFIAKRGSGGSNIFNLENYNSFTFLDSLHYQGNILIPHLGNYEVSGNYIYVPYLDNDHCKSETVNGREISLPTNMSIVKFSFIKNGKAHMEMVYKLDEGEKDAPNIYYSGTFYYRISDKGIPIGVNQTRKNITFLDNGAKIDFGNFISGINDTVNFISDIAMKGDTLKFVATTTSNNTVKIIYNIHTRKYIVNRIPTKLLYHSFRIHEDTILAYRKNDVANEIALDQFTF